MILKSKNSAEEQHRREIKNVTSKANKLGKSVVPNFSFGANELGLDDKNQLEALKQFVKHWFDDPGSFLDFKRYTPYGEPIVTKTTELKEQCYNFESFIDKNDLGKFYESRQPFYGINEKIAFIILPHWNAYFHKYKHGTAIIRNCFLPVATYRYFPKYQTDKDFVGKPRYDIVGTNLGLTIKRFWQDVLNVQFFAKYLKTELGYNKVGIWAYSIGSPRGYLASMFSDGLIDYLIMNSLADSFPESLLHGIATKPIAQEILKNIDENTAEYLLSPLSPGQYEKYLDRLPHHTRLVQSKYDLVFGEENNRRIVELFENKAPFIDIEYGKFGHTTCGEIDKVIPVVFRNSKFIFNNSELKFRI